MINDFYSFAQSKEHELLANNQKDKKSKKSILTMILTIIAFLLILDLLFSSSIAENIPFLRKKNVIYILISLFLVTSAFIEIFLQAKEKKLLLYKKPGIRILEDWLKTVVFFGAFYLAFINIVAEPYRIPSGSMEPTLHGDMRFLHGDHILAWKGISKLEPLERGDIVAFISVETPDMFVIKRLVGLPGDEVYIQYPHVYINGEKLEYPEIFKSIHYEHANHGIRYQFATNKNKPFKVPQNCYFVMGDNSRNSKDSRVWGWLPQENILGKAALIWFPFSRANMLEPKR